MWIWSGLILLRNPILLWFFRGVRTPCPPSGSAHEWCWYSPIFGMFLKQIFSAYLQLLSARFVSYFVALDVSARMLAWTFAVRNNGDVWKVYINLCFVQSRLCLRCTHTWYICNQNGATLQLINLSRIEYSTPFSWTSSLPFGEIHVNLLPMFIVNVSNIIICYYHLKTLIRLYWLIAQHQENCEITSE